MRLRLWAKGPATACEPVQKCARLEDLNASESALLQDKNVLRSLGGDDFFEAKTHNPCRMPEDSDTDVEGAKVPCGISFVPCATTPMQIPADITSGAVTLGYGQWTLGSNVGTWFGNPATVPPQATVIIANLFYNLQSVQTKILKPVARALEFTWRSKEDFIARLQGLGRGSLDHVWLRLQQRHWDPRCEEEGSSEDGDAQDRKVDADMKALISSVRTVMGSAFDCVSQLGIQRQLSRLRLDGISVGDRCQSNEFCKSVETLGFAVMQAVTFDALRAPVRGLLIPSDFAVVFDPVSLGTSSFSEHETLVPIGFRCAKPSDGMIVHYFHSAPSQGHTKTGVATARLVENSIMERRGVFNGLSRKRLRACLVSTGGDGGLCKGGENARHGSSGAAELLYKSIFPESDVPLTYWEEFHRGEAGGRHGVKTSTYYMETLDVSRVMFQLFGTGQGKVILKGVHEWLVDDQEMHKLKKPANNSGTRPLAYFHRLVGALLANYRDYHMGMEVREKLVREQISGQTLSRLIAVGRRLSSLDFVTFLIIVEVDAEMLRKFAVFAQETHEPVPAYIHTHLFGQQLLDCIGDLEAIRGYVQIGMFLSAYITRNDLISFFL